MGAYRMGAYQQALHQTVKQAQMEQRVDAGGGGLRNQHVVDKAAASMVADEFYATHTRIECATEIRRRYKELLQQEVVA